MGTISLVVGDRIFTLDAGIAQPLIDDLRIMEQRDGSYRLSPRRFDDRATLLAAIVFPEIETPEPELEPEPDEEPEEDGEPDYQFPTGPG